MFKSFNGPQKSQNQIHSFFIDDHYLRTTLTEAKIWFADPKGFNDPFDCNIPTASIVSEKEAMSYFEKQEPDMLPEQRLQRIQKVIADPENQSLNYMNQIYLLSLGIRCFSRKDDEILMWAHYGKSHTGVCLSFDITKDESFFSIEELLAVSYEKDFTDFDFIKYGSNVSQEDLAEKMRMHYVGIKSKAWNYEDEIRLVKSVDNVFELAKTYHPQAPTPKDLFELVNKSISEKNKNGLTDRKRSFKKEALVEIKFGVNTSQNSIEEIRRIVQDYNYEVKLKKAVANKRTFGIEFIEC